MSGVKFLANRIKRRIGRLAQVLIRGPSIQKYADTAYKLASLVPLADHADVSIHLTIIVPTYNSNVGHLQQLITSFFEQEMNNVELILVDDASTTPGVVSFLDGLVHHQSIRVIERQENGGIARASMTGLEEATGRYVTFLDHDDVIAPHALKLILNTLHANPELKFLYTDELIMDVRGKFFNHITKPAFDPVLLSGINYINHFSVFRRDRLLELDGLRTGFDGSQDYELVLRYTSDLKDQEIAHLPYPAYWWRHGEKNFSLKNYDSSIEKARNALKQNFENNGLKVTVGEALNPMLHRVHLDDHREEWPLVSIIIPSKNSLRLIKQTLEGLFEKTDYPAFEVLVVDNGTNDPAVLDLYRRYSKEHNNFHADIKVEPFNFARSINRGFRLAKVGTVLLLNNDVEMIEPDWLKEMVSCLAYDRAGIVGAKLLYPDNTIQHAGVVVGHNQLASHWFYKEKRDFDGPMKRLHVRQSMSCVTGAVMLISKECREAVGLWDEENFAVAYNDVDYCMRAHALHFRIIWTPFAELYHHESATRGPDKDKKKAERFAREKAALKRIHGTETYDDPCFNPWFAKRYSRPKFRILENLPEARMWWLG